MKISYENIEKIIKNCTGKEISLIIHLAQYQNAQGVVEGIEYNDAAAATVMSVQSFYNALNGLQNKGIIEIDDTYSLHGFFKITILNNVFETKQDFKKGYININLEFLHSERFHKLSKVTKILLLKIYKIQDNTKKRLIFSFKSIAKWTGIQFKNVKRSLKQLAELFTIEFACNTAIISLLHEGCDNILSAVLNTRRETEASVQNEHEIKTELIKQGLITKKERNDQPKEVLDNLNQLFRQYIKSLGKGMIMDAILDCFKRYRTLIPAYINKTLSNIYRSLKKKRLGV